MSQATRVIQTSKTCRDHMHRLSENYESGIFYLGISNHCFLGLRMDILDKKTIIDNFDWNAFYILYPK